MPTTAAKLLVNRRAPLPGDHELMIAEGDVDLARAIERADVHNLSYRLTWLTQRALSDPNELGVERFTVPSVRFPGQQYNVGFDPNDGTYHCRCEGAQHGRLCLHAGAVAKWLWRLRRDLSPAGQATQRAYERWCEQHGF